MLAPESIARSAVDFPTEDKDGVVSINIVDFAQMISAAADLMEKGVFHHGERVAYIAYRIHEEIYPYGDSLPLIIGSYLHDIGISTFELKEEARHFLLDKDLVFGHCLDGEMLVQDVRLLNGIRPLILHHHTDYGEESSLDNTDPPLEAQIIHLADRVDVLIKNNMYILEQSKDIIETIESHSGTMFNPMLVSAFMDLAVKESFWLDVVNEYKYSVLKDRHRYRQFIMKEEDIRQFANMCGRMVDRKSPYTAAHSKRVAEIAVRLGRLFGMTDNEVFQLEIAGLLHDLGKLSVPEDILHKAGKLSREEFNIIKQHTYHTYQLIDQLKMLDKIRDWAGFHHEKLDGSGYPFHKRGQELDLGARILAVADISTALSEDRSYRKRMTKDEVLDILWGQVRNNWIDGDVVRVVEKYYAEVIM